MATTTPPAEMPTATATATPTGSMTTEQQAQYTALTMKLQRDVNCVADPDRSVRRRALDKLQRALSSDDVTHLPPIVLTTLFRTHLQAPLLTCAGEDTVEKCREKALALLLVFADRQALEYSQRTLEAIVTLLSSRLGKLPYPEPTEEIRLQLLQLAHVYLTHLAANSSNSSVSMPTVMPDLANVVGKTALDPFPDVKKCAADCAIVLAHAWPAAVALQLSPIVKPLVVNLGHQHSRVRVGALQALEALVPCGADALRELLSDVLVPALRTVVFDRAPAVRKQLVLTVASWFARLTTIEQFDAALFPLLLAGVVDESPDVCNAAQTQLDTLAVLWQTQRVRDENDESEPMAIDAESSSSDAVDVQSSAASLYFGTHALAASTRQLAARIHADVLPELLEKTNDWTVQVRERYTKILSAFLILLGANMNASLVPIVAALGKICQDDEQRVVASVRECLRVVGCYADAQMILASLLPMAAGRVAGQDTAQHRTHGLILLSMSIEGMTHATIAPHLMLITEALCDAGLRESEVADLQDQLAQVVASIVQTAGPTLLVEERNDDVAFRLFWVLNHVLASASESSIAYETAEAALQELALMRQQSVEELYGRFLGRILDTIALSAVDTVASNSNSNSSSSWTKSAPSRILFDALCRRGGAACGANMDKIVPVLLVHLDAQRDADVRLAFLALLETMLSADATFQAFARFSTSLLLNGIIPNIVWQGGRVAATIRKVAVACAYTLLRRGLADQSCLFATAPKLLPVLKSSMDDNDAKTRQLVCLALQYLFVALPGCLGEEPVHQLYAEILKRLDDSNDTVRKAACETFSTFLRAAPHEYFRGTIIDYTLDCLFVHLDDADASVQDAVFRVIQDAISIDKALVAKKATENCSRHQSPRLCEQLLALANSAGVQ